MLAWIEGSDGSPPRNHHIPNIILCDIACSSCCPLPALVPHRAIHLLSGFIRGYRGFWKLLFPSQSRFCTPFHSADIEFWLTSNRGGFLSFILLYGCCWVMSMPWGSLKQFPPMTPALEELLKQGFPGSESIPVILERWTIRKPLSNLR